LSNVDQVSPILYNQKKYVLQIHVKIYLSPTSVVVDCKPTLGDNAQIKMTLWGYTVNQHPSST